MSSAAKKLVYTLQAVYEGKAEIKQLNSDLNELKRIEAFQGMLESFKKTNTEFVAAKAKLRELRAEMKQPGGEAYAASYAAAQKSVDRLAASLGKQKIKIDESRGALKSAGLDVTNLAGRYDELKGAAEKNAKVLAAQAKLGIKPLADVERQVKGLKQAYKELEKSGTMSLRELFSAKSAMLGKVQKLRSETLGWKDNLDKVKSGWVGIAGVVATVAASARGIKLFAGFDDSMRQVQAVSGATGEDFAKLTGLAKKMGETTRFSASEAAQGMGELAQSGMDTEEIFKTLPQALDLASISGGSIKESADLITDTMAQFRLEMDDSARVADVLTQGYTGASTSLQDLGVALSYAGPVTASLGYELEDTVAILQALAEAGFKGSRGGTALVGGLTRLIKPSSEAAAILKKYGITVFDAAGKTRNFADIMEDVGDAAMGPAEMMTVFGQEAGPGMAGLLGQGSDAIRKFTGELENAGGTAGRVAGQMEAGIGGSLRSLWSSLSAVVMAFAEDWAPAIKTVADWLTTLARSIAAMPEPLRMLVSGIGLAIAASAAWTLGLGSVVTTMATAAGGVLGLVGKIPALVGAMNGAAFSGSALAVVLGQLAAALGALWVGYKAGEWLLMHKHMADIAALTEQNVKSTEKLAEKYAEISEATGLVITSMKDLDAAVKAGKVYYDETTGEWKKRLQEVTVVSDASAAAQKAGMLKALEDMAAGGGAYADKIKELQAEITASGSGSAEDQKAATISALDEMSAKYGDYADKIKKMQDEIAGKESAPQDDPTSPADETAALTEKSKQFNQDWNNAWDSFLENGDASITELENRLNALSKNGQISVEVREVVQRAGGGLAGYEPMKFAAGGSPLQHFPRLSNPYITSGSGLRDDVPALLKKKEFVQPDTAVDFYGLRFMEMIRRRMLPRNWAKQFALGGSVGFSVPLPMPAPVMMETGGSVGAAAAGAAAVSRVVEIRFPSGSLYGAESVTEAVLRDLQKMGAMS
jgi:TP901 family phage tail tape measure protein